MTVSISVLIVLVGCVAGLGLWLIASSFYRDQVRLGDALALLNPDSVTAEEEATAMVQQFSDPSSRIEKASVLISQKLHLPISNRTLRLLALRGRSLGDHFAAKLFLAMSGFLTPMLLGWLSLMLNLGWGSLPLLAALVFGVGGYLLPDYLLRRDEQSSRSDAAEAMSVFFDLVILERLSNASATQAVTNAAALCDAPVFVRIRAGLEKARLQQRPPWQEMHRLAEELRVPALGDVADILSLDEQGAALAGALRARVRELRKAHLADRKQAATAAAEGMTLWMVIPVLIFALFFLAPPLLRLTGLG